MSANGTFVLGRDAEGRMLAIRRTGDSFALIRSGKEAFGQLTIPLTREQIRAIAEVAK